jgi:hypothetical protein
MIRYIGYLLAAASLLAASNAFARSATQDFSGCPNDGYRLYDLQPTDARDYQDLLGQMLIGHNEIDGYVSEPDQANADTKAFDPVFCDNEPNAMLGFSGSGTIAVDDSDVEPVTSEVVLAPEPATLAFVGFGAVSLCLRRRRR